MIIEIKEEKQQPTFFNESVISRYEDVFKC